MSKRTCKEMKKPTSNSRKGVPRRRYIPPPAEFVIDAKNAEEARYWKLINAEAKPLVDASIAKDPYVKMAAWELRVKALAGDEDALTSLLFRTHECVQALNSIANEKPSLLQPIARLYATWPVMDSRSSTIRRKNEELFDKIDLAAAVGTSGIEEGVVNTSNSPKKKWAISLLQFILGLREYLQMSDGSARLLEPLKEKLNRSDAEWYLFQISQLNRMLSTFVAWPLECQKYTLDIANRCVALPDFSDEKSVIDQWWAVGRDLLELNTDGLPEKFPSLYAIGKSQAASPVAVKIDLNGVSFDTGTSRSRVRQGIRGELKDEFRIIATEMKNAQRSEQK